MHPTPNDFPKPKRSGMFLLGRFGLKAELPFID
jgi:hypothetical protein